MVLGLGMLVAGTTNGWGVVPVAVIVAGCDLFVSGLYPTDPAGAPTTTGAVHSLASGSATLTVIGAVVVSCLPIRADGHGSVVGLAGVLAAAALVLGAVSPVLHGTAWTGLSQRLLWLTLLSWLLATAWRLSPATDRAG